MADESALTWRATTRDYFVDIVGACNLRCPSCGNGNMPPGGRPTSYMPLDLFDRVLERIATDSAGGEKPPSVSLFNWGEPLLHPDAAEMIARVRRRGFHCCVSTNLNRPRDLEGVVQARPDWFRISVSGFRQETYGRTHKQGDVERVKENMRRLRELMDAHRASFPVHVYYHLYRHNVRFDYNAMKDFATELRFSFEAVWAVPAPVEKVVEWLEAGVPEADQDLVDLLVIRPPQAREITLAHADQVPGCPLIDATIVNSDGSVDLCCATYQQRIAPSFLESTAADLRALKVRWPLCGKCMSHGLHLVGVYAPKNVWDARALAVLESELAPPEHPTG